jgi:2-polyprenyl-3-methyl-5-hydroxy-6-metoxy-1,4-benzoquinol methylase
MTPILQYILDYLEQKAPAHAARVRLGLEQESGEYLSKASSFFMRYKNYIEGTGKTLDYGLDCYLKLLAHMVHERLEFLRSGKYASSSFADVEKQIYLNPDLFEYHMHGLVFAQFFWPEQSSRFQFFSSHIGRELDKGGRYLEIGGGHGLYILEAMNQAPRNTQFHLVDISPSSMELAKGITDGLPIDYRLMNIVDYAPTEQFDFITIGEVIEHVEDPLSLLKRVRELLAPGGSAFISTPANSPTIDHIYLFQSADEIRAMVNSAGFEIRYEKVRFSENVSPERAEKLKVAVMFAAFARS